MGFFLKKLTPAKLNYKIYNKKLLTIIAALQKQKVYLKNTKYLIQIYINYKNLLTFTTIK